MGILSSIKDKLFGTKTTAATTAATGTAATATTSAGTAATTATPTTPIEPVDVVAIIEAAVKAKGQPSNWRVSIVDLLKALDIDSSFAARKELADELKYKGAYSGTAEQNIWLHKTVMQMIADNGGKIPKELLK